MSRAPRPTGVALPLSILLAVAASGAAAVASEPALLAAGDPLSFPPPASTSSIVLPADDHRIEEKILPSLWARVSLAETGDLRVIVTLKEPQLPTAGRSVGQIELERVDALAVLEHRFAAQAEALGMQNLQGLSHFPIVFGQLPADRLLDLATLQEVLAVEEDGTVFTSRSEGGELVKADRLRTQHGGTGAGIGVAVVDTGVDDGHRELSSRVVAQGNYTPESGDGTNDGQGHGTSVAGIIAGTSGGVAPRANIWALRALDRQGRGNFTWILNALNSAYAGRNLFGGLHLINMSLGNGVRYSQNCDAVSPAFTTAINQLLAAGVVSFVSSGNDAYKNGVAFPACLSNVVAVGAVYDENIGSASFSNCSDRSTSADKITCYSNSGGPLDLLAPSHCARTPSPGGGYEDCFGGTSAAAPYAAGVAAQLLSLHPSTTPGQLFNAMVNTGRARTDTNGLTRNRIDALAAHQALGGGGSTDPCVPNETTLCLDDQAGDRRFKVQMRFDNNNAAGFGKAIPLNSLGVSQGGLFYISQRTNPELLIKVINACVAPFNRFWVFYAATTNQGLTTTVTDTRTGRTWIRTNPRGTVAPPVQDTQAFPCT